MARRWVLGVAALGVALAGCGGPQAAPSSAPTPTVSTASTPATTAPVPTTASPASPGTAACTALAASLPLREQAGQLVMGVVTEGLDEAETRSIRTAQLGSVILMGTSEAGVSGTRARTDAIRGLAGPTGLLIAVDQEGGLVQRLKGPGFDTIPAAKEQATWAPAELTAKAAAWGGQLKAAGVNLDLAPVADVVPAGQTSTNEPIGKLGRGYGTTPQAVGPRVTAFIRGLQQAGVGASVKHFPTLGRVTGNTDFAAGVDDTVTTATDPALGPFKDAIAADVESVMVATARYTRIDASSLAAFSPKVIGILRGDLGYSGVVISDDLGVAKAVADVRPQDRAVRFVRAGGDLAISVQPSVATSMVEGLVAAAEADPAFRSRVGESATRVLALKARLGVTTCG